MKWTEEPLVHATQFKGFIKGGMLTYSLVLLFWEWCSLLQNMLFTEMGIIVEPLHSWESYLCQTSISSSMVVCLGRLPYSRLTTVYNLFIILYILEIICMIAKFIRHGTIISPYSLRVFYWNSLFNIYILNIFHLSVYQLRERRISLFFLF